MKKETYRFFAYRRIVSLITIKDGMIGMQLSRETGINDSTTPQYLKFLKTEGLVTAKKEGRCKRIYLTSKGKELKNRFIEIINMLEK